VQNVEFVINFVVNDVTTGLQKINYTYARENELLFHVALYIL